MSNGNSSVMPSDDVASDTPAGVTPAETGVTASPKRLVITKIVMENFKSYAGEVTVGVFHKFFSAIVGPNGSGKSNVIDAILFVFGRKAKSLRQKKVSDLIHNSETYKSLQSCRVSVYFQDIIDSPEDPEMFEVVPGSEFVVSRTANRSNASSYYFNGKLSSYTHVTEMLMTRGIDLVHNRFLILQGEVEQIAMMPPKGQTEHEEGMLEYLEDIIGSDVFKEQIAAKAEEVEGISEERTAKLNRVKANDKEMAALKGPMTEALEYITMSNELTKTRSKLYQLNLLDSTERYTETTEALTTCRAQLQEHQAQMKHTAKQSKELDKKMKKESKECDVLKDAVEKARTNFAAFERKDIKLREDLKHNSAKVKSTDKALATAEKSRKTASNASTTFDADLAKHDKNIAELEKSLKAEEKKLDVIVEGLKDETQDVQRDLAQKQKELEPWCKDINTAQASASMIQQEIDIIEQASSDSRTRLQTAEATVKESGATQKQHKTQIAQLTSKLEANTRGLEKETKRLQELEKEEAPLRARVNVCRSTLEESKANASTSRSRNAVYDALMKQKQSNRIKGIHGRLGDLGTIQSKYDVGITTACGALNNFVVDSTETGQKCVEYLRKHKLGRATFLILSEVERLRQKASAKVATPENIPRLFDLVRPNDPKYDTAFYYALRDTLVADTLDSATRVAYGPKRRWRVVTLEGQLIDTSGTMSGGGGKVSRGGMSADRRRDAVDPATIQKHETALAAAMEKVAAFAREKEAVADKVTQLKVSLKTTKVELTKVQMEATALVELVEHTRKSLPGLQKTAEKSAAETRRVAALKQKVAVLEKELRKAEDGAAPITQAIESLQSKLLSIGGVRLSAQKAKVDTLRQQIELEEKGMAKVNVAKKTAGKNAVKLEGKISKLTGERAEVAATVAQIRQDLDVLEASATEVVKALKTTEETLEDKESSMSVLKQSYQSANEEVQKAKALEVDLSNKVDEVARQSKDSQHNMNMWTKKIEKLELQEMPCIEDDDEAAGKDADKKEPEKLETLDGTVLRELDVGDLEYDITIGEEKLSKLKPNLAAITEYQVKNHDFMEKVQELESITEKRDALRLEHDSLRKKRLDVFMEGFTVIGMKLKEMYQMITLGGDAELELLDSLDPFSEGIQFSVRPPKKSWKNISNLSGGEKTLSSLALVFALHHYQPTPLYVMDEIDAALDFKNVSIVANYIKERTKNAQFIIISLRNNMFELANLLVGIYKTDNCTKSVTINPTKMKALQEEEGKAKDAPVDHSLEATAAVAA